MNLREQAARGVFWSAAGNWGYQLTTLIVFVILSRQLSPEAFGLVALATVFTALMKLIAEQGLVDAVVQRANIEPEHLDTAFWISLGFGTVLAGLLAASAGFIADLVDEPDVAPVLMWLSLSLVVAGFSSVQRAILTRDLQFASLTLRTLSSVLAGAVVGITAAFMGFGVWSLVAQLLTIEVVGAIALWSASDWRPGMRFSVRHGREMISFGVNVVGFRLLRFANTRVDNLVIGSALGVKPLGYYVVAYRLLELMINTTTSIMGSVIFPVFSRMQDDRKRVRNAYYDSIRLSSAIAFPSFLGLLAIAPEVTLFIFGSQWEPSIPVMRVLALAGLVNSIMFVNGIVMKALGKPSWRLAIAGVTSALLVASFVGVVQRGILAVATAFAIVTLVVAPLWLIGAHRLIGLEAGRYIRQLVGPLVASSVMIGLVFVLKPVLVGVPDEAAIPTLVVAGALSYSIALWFVGNETARQAGQMARLAIPARRKTSH
jgi:PST family polysaccharide transporter